MPDVFESMVYCTLFSPGFPLVPEFQHKIAEQDKEILELKRRINELESSNNNDDPNKKRKLF